MKVTRKDFLKTGALLSGGLFFGSNKMFSNLQTQTYIFKELRNNIGIFTERGGTIGWHATNDGVVVIDAQYPETAKNLIAALQQKTSHKIDVLFNTHHHGDHTSGNIFLKDYAGKIVAHENCKMLQEKNDKKDPAKPQAYATLTFKETWGAQIGNEKVTAKYFGPAHTSGDSVIHFEDADIAHVGDLVFNQTFPFIDSNGGGSIKLWYETLGKIINHYSKDTLFIFGHAISESLLTGSIADIVNMRSYLGALAEHVESEIQKGKSKEEIAAAEIPGFANLKERWQGARKMNLEKAYDELVKK
ncbi:MAG: metallo-beta-lactamase superfamily protein [Ignavibacteria bacterium]|nr:MAG: metallo-beta-lactamase superfamily protein [Ignavibacteria bacterium]KAF0156889.1 MAG: metallo-beta-lactamase superfamily protein [Ignavibacteria bacterium]